ncbi:hypothetical protein PFNF54_02388 [Plasmodium falciparum NF54]|uniref:Uncharacterized protein n=1 Tax=Plasmodium falciparum (isolate NF54) TaxID=5843 RepID=W7K623_PLAFO|nr:hypothetical protein PFNF54_02388 [Plasmodium falciparum NF54]
MTNKQNCSSFPCYIDEENKKGKLNFISFKFLCLCLYMIGFLYIFLNISLENKSLEKVENYHIYERNLSEAEKNNNRSQRKKNFKT